MPMSLRLAEPLNLGKTPVLECGSVLSPGEFSSLSFAGGTKREKLFVLDTRLNCWYLVAVWKFCLKKNELSPRRWAHYFFRRVAQLVRALARHARGRRFESARAYQKTTSRIFWRREVSQSIFC